MLVLKTDAGLEPWCFTRLSNALGNFGQCYYNNFCCYYISQGAEQGYMYNAAVGKQLLS